MLPTPLTWILLVCALAYDGVITIIALALSGVVEASAYALRQIQDDQQAEALAQAIVAEEAAQN